MGDHETFKLETHHYGWMLDAAIRSFEKSIEEQELAILRHEHFMTEDFPNALEKTRADRLESARRFLREYREVLRFLVAQKKRFIAKAAEEAAREIETYLRPRARRRR